MQAIKALLISLIVLVLCSRQLQAQGIYKWTDKDGITHYSSNKAANPKANLAKLPKINHGEVDLGKYKLKTCNNHGGIDCQAGVDKDGSVICYDGFRGAAARYRFSCSTPKLELTASDLKDGKYIVSIRNAKAVIAKQMSVSARLQDGSKVTLSGPKSIGAYGIEDYVFELDRDKQNEKLDSAQISIMCSNCPS